MTLVSNPCPPAVFEIPVTTNLFDSSSPPWFVIINLRLSPTLTPPKSSATVSPTTIEFLA